MIVCVCGHSAEHHDPDDGCGACAMAMVGPCRSFRPRSTGEHLTFHTAPDRPLEVGTPVIGETTEGESITWYVTHVSEDGTITVGAEKPGE